MRTKPVAPPPGHCSPGFVEAFNSLQPPVEKKTITVEIKHRWTGAILYSMEVDKDCDHTLRETVNIRVAKHVLLGHRWPIN